MPRALITCAFVLVAAFLSCQKQLHDPGVIGGLTPPPAVGDSVTLIQSLSYIGYDTTGKFNYRGTEWFSYDTLQNRIIVDMADSDQYGDNRKSHDVFQYNNSHQLTRFTDSGGVEEPTQMDIVYDNNGNPGTAAVQDKDLGNFTYTFSTGLVNGKKTIVQTAPAVIPISPFAVPPCEKAIYSFDSKGRLTACTDQFNKQPGNWFENDESWAYTYDDNGFLSKLMYWQNYLPQDNSAPLMIFKDSTLYTADLANTVLQNSYANLYAGVDWIGFPAKFISFALYPGFQQVFSSATVKSVADWQFQDSYLPAAPPPVFNQAVIINTYNAAGLLVKQEVPPPFGDKYGGKLVTQYTYITMKKK